MFKTGENNTIKLETGLDPYTPQGCSADNRLIYTLRLSRLVGYGNVHAKSEGCDWTIEFEDNSIMNSPLPSSYNGTQLCYYTAVNSSGVYPQNDAYADAVNRLLRQLDADADGRVDLIFDQNMIEFEFGRAGGVRSLWGPIKAKLVVWI